MYKLIIFRHIDENYNMESFLLCESQEWDNIVKSLTSKKHKEVCRIISLAIGFFCTSINDFLDTIIVQTISDFEYDTINLLLGPDFGDLYIILTQLLNE